MTEAVEGIVSRVMCRAPLGGQVVSGGIQPPAGSVRGQPVVAAEANGLVFQRSGRESPQVLQRAGHGDVWQVTRLGEHGARLSAHISLGRVAGRASGLV